MQNSMEKATLVVFSGEMDKIMAAFIIATGAAAAGMETTMFFTFWGLQALKKKKKTGKGLFGKMLGLFLKDLSKIGPSKMNFGGIGRWMFKKMMMAKNVTPLEELRKLAIDLGIKLIACQMSMDVMEISREDLIDEVTAVAGVATYIKEAKDSNITLFI